jgi:hypothetical protein
VLPLKAEGPDVSIEACYRPGIPNPIYEGMVAMRSAPIKQALTV